MVETTLMWSNIIRQNKRFLRHGEKQQDIVIDEEGTCSKTYIWCVGKESTCLDTQQCKKSLKKK